MMTGDIAETSNEQSKVIETTQNEEQYEYEEHKYPIEPDMDNEYRDQDRQV